MSACPCCDRTDGTHPTSCSNQNPFYALQQYKDARREATRMSREMDASDPANDFFNEETPL